MKKVFLIIILGCSMGSICGQNVSLVLQDIERNNTTLKMLRAQAEARKTEARTDIHLDNPEVDLGYLWGSPANIGNRFDFNVTQRFDFPTTYYFKNKIANEAGRAADYEYAAARRQFLTEAAEWCVRLIYFNIMREEFQHHIEVAQSITEAYQKMYDAGEANMLDLNKAKLNLLTANREFEDNLLERSLILAELQRLNGGHEVLLNDTLYPNYTLPSDFDNWYRQIETLNPEIQELTVNQEICRREIQLSKSQWAPHFTIGYNSESTLGTILQGVGVGVELPLWQNRHAVKSAQAQNVVAQTALLDAKTQYYSELHTQYEQAQRLLALYNEYMQVLYSVNTDLLLKKALDSGEIPLIEYIMERNVYHESLHDAFAAQRDYYLAVIKLLLASEF